jgi:P pilus assembly chaperone PapD
MTLPHHIISRVNRGMPLRSLLGVCVLGAGLLLSMGAHAGVVISGTRVIFPAQDREATVKLSNEGKQPALVQIWIDKGQASANPDALKVPFTVSPPITRIEPSKGQVLRVVYTGEPLPTDRESLFYFNMLEVPPKTAKSEDGSENFLKFAVRTRIKLFYRPQGLTGTSDDAIKDLHWSLVRDGNNDSVKIANNSPYYVSLGRIEATADGHAYVAEGNGVVPPLGTVQFVFKGMSVNTPPSSVKLSAVAINDYGAHVSLNPVLTP